MSSHDIANKTILESQVGVSSKTSADDVITVDELEAAANARGLVLSLKTLGPFFRVTARYASFLGLHYNNQIETIG